MADGLQKYNARSKLIQWSERVSACRASGMPVKAWCAQEGSSETSYYYWQRKVFQASQEQRAGFVEVSGNIPIGNTVAATVSVNGYRIEIHSGADKKTLKALLQAVRTC